PPTARTIDVWLITGGHRAEIGAAASVLSRFQLGRVVIADPNPWTATLRALVQQAQVAGVQVQLANGRINLDGVAVQPAPDGRTWLIQSGQARMAVIPPETSWLSMPADIDAAIFTSGGPPDWQGRGR